MHLGNVSETNQACAQRAAQILFEGYERGDLTQATREMNGMIDDWVEGKKWAKRSVRKFAVEAIENYLNKR